LTGVKFDVPAPRSIGELIAMAIAMEREAASRYDLLAADMVTAGRQELADLFENLAAEERKHEAYIEAWQNTPLPAATFKWRSPESLTDDQTTDAGGATSMTPHRALALAVHNEERAFAFFSSIAAAAGDSEIRERAEKLATEELDHVVRLRLERRRAHRAEAEAPARAAAKKGIRAVRSIEALHARAAVIEAEAARDVAACLTAVQAAGDERAAAMLRHIEQAISEMRATLPNEQASEPVSTDSLSQPTDITVLMGRVFVDAEDALAFYLAVAENATTQEVMERAQEFAERALERLSMVRAHQP
jgi:rubrerythrin